MNKTKIISGMAVHCHHKILFEHCYNYQERVDCINRTKPENERKVRLERFKMLTEEQVAMLPQEFVEASRKYHEAWEKLVEACKKLVEACKKLVEPCKKYKPQLEEVHRKICGCKEWNGKMMVFEK